MVEQKNLVRNKSMDLYISYDNNEVNFDDVSDLLHFYGLTDLPNDKIKQAFLNSQIVVYIFDKDENMRLIGCGRAISDMVSHGAIFNIAIVEEMHKKGIGKLIIDSLALKMQGQIITLYTHPNTIKFYEKCGFKKLNTALIKFRDYEINIMKDMKFID
jgi:ribosomal protein S18 acetylase RimI-like enzyme